jgi:hypothetical protein
VITGTQALQQRVLARQRRAHLARTASDLQIPLQALEAFGHGADNLTVAQKELLTKEFFMPARYDATSDRLIDLNTPTTWKAQIPPPTIRVRSTLHPTIRTNIMAAIRFRTIQIRTPASDRAGRVAN